MCEKDLGYLLFYLCKVSELTVIVQSNGCKDLRKVFAIRLMKEA